MPVGWDAQIKGTGDLSRAVRLTAKRFDIDVSEDVFDILVTRAIANILRESSDDKKFRELVQHAITVLPELRLAILGTGPASFRNVASFRSFVRAKSCACPYPWGTG